MKFTRSKKRKSKKKKIGGKIADSKYCSKLVLNCDKKTTDGELDKDDGDCNYYFDIDGNMCRNSKYYKVLMGKKGLQCRKTASDGEKKCDINKLNTDYLENFTEKLNKECFGDDKYFSHLNKKLNLDEFINKFMVYPKRRRSQNGIIIFNNIKDIDVNFQDCFLSEEISDLLTHDNKEKLVEINNKLNNLFQLDVEYRKKWDNHEESTLLLLQYNLFKKQSQSTLYKTLYNNLLEVYIKSIYLLSCWFGMKELIKIYNQLNKVTSKSQLLRLQSHIVKLKIDPSWLFHHIYSDLKHKVIEKFIETIEKQIIPKYIYILEKFNKTENPRPNRQSSSNSSQSSSNSRQSSSNSRQSIQSEYISTLYKTPERQSIYTKKAQASSPSSNYTRRASPPRASSSRGSTSKPSNSNVSPPRSSPPKSSPPKNVEIDPSWLENSEGENFEKVIDNLNKNKGISIELKKALSNKKPRFFLSKIEIPDYSSLFDESQSKEDDPNDPTRPIYHDTETTRYIQNYFKAPVHAFYSTDPSHDDRNYF